jgi:hypothetical protein
MFEIISTYHEIFTFTILFVVVAMFILQTRNSSKILEILKTDYTKNADRTITLAKEKENVDSGDCRFSEIDS